MNSTLEDVEDDDRIEPGVRVVILDGPWIGNVGYAVKKFAIVGNTVRFWNIRVTNELSDDVFFVSVPESNVMRSPYQGEDEWPIG